MLSNGGTVTAPTQGLAWLNGICNVNTRDAFTDTGPSVPFNSRIYAVAHMIGHSIGLKHADGINEPTNPGACGSTYLMCILGPAGLKFISADMQNTVVGTAQASCLQ